jgi:hypothetical protein
MSDLAPNFLTPGQRLQEVLLGYLQTAPPIWPGADGLTLEDALSSYRQAATARVLPGLMELLERYPDLAEEFLAFFA